MCSPCVSSSNYSSTPEFEHSCDAGMVISGRHWRVHLNMVRQPDIHASFMIHVRHTASLGNAAPTPARHTIEMQPRAVQLTERAPAVTVQPFARQGCQLAGFRTTFDLAHNRCPLSSQIHLTSYKRNKGGPRTPELLSRSLSDTCCSDHRRCSCSSCRGSLPVHI